jgi:hypothetical protein
VGTDEFDRFVVVTICYLSISWPGKRRVVVLLLQADWGEGVLPPPSMLVAKRNFRIHTQNPGYAPV